MDVASGKKNTELSLRISISPGKPLYPTENAPPAIRSTTPIIISSLPIPSILLS